MKLNPAPKSLRHLQRWLRWIIPEPSGVDAALRKSKGTNGREPRPRCLDRIVDAPPIPRAERLSVYAEAYFSRISDCLSEDFKALNRVLCSLLGKSAFHVFVADYLTRFPSRSPNIAEVGKNLPAFIKQHRFNRGLRFLPDLARWEWLLIEAFYSPAPIRRESTKTGTVPIDGWEKAKIRLQPSVRLIQTVWPVDTISKRRRFDEKWLLGLKPEKTYLMIWQDQNRVTFERISEIQWKILSSLDGRRTLQEICMLILRGKVVKRLSPNLITRSFAHWIKQGVIELLPTRSINRPDTEVINEAQ